MGNADFFEQFIILTRQGYSHLLPLSSEALCEGGTPFREKRGILRLENTGFFEQSVILTHPPPSGATSSGFTTNRLRRDKQGGKAAVFTSSLQNESFVTSHLLPLSRRSLVRRRKPFSKKAKYLLRGLLARRRILLRASLSSVIVRYRPLASACKRLENIFCRQTS